MFLLRWCLAVAFLLGLTACQTSSGGTPSSLTSSTDTPSPLASDDNPASGTSEAKQLVHCQRPLGKTTLVEPDANTAAALQSVGLQSPTPVLRILISQSNCFRLIDRAAAGGQAAAQYAITPNLLLSNPDAGGFNAAGLITGVVAFIPGGALLSGAGANVHTKEVQTALFLSDGRSGEQILAVQGMARATDFNISFAGLGGGANSVGAYGNSPDGKVVMAAYLDAFDKLVAQMQQGKTAQAPPTR